jgi:hypothetical protein
MKHVSKDRCCKDCNSQWRESDDKRSEILCPSCKGENVYTFDPVGPWNWPTLEKVNYEICGCGECDDCKKLTKKIEEHLTEEQKQFDRDVTTFRGKKRI